MKIFKGALVMGALSVALFVVAPYAQAKIVKFSAELTGRSEVTPTSSTAKGSAEVALDTATNNLSWTINFDGLTGPPTSAHFHAPANANEKAPQL
jgi:CHRD domain